MAAGWLAALCYALIAGFEVPAQLPSTCSRWWRSVYGQDVISAFAAPCCWPCWRYLLLDPWAVLATGFWLSLVLSPCCLCGFLTP